MPYILQFEEGGATKELEVNEPELVIGRAPDCGLVINAPGISRRHCAIRREQDGVYIQDLDSKNGTRVNSVEVARAKLKPNDKVMVAEKVLLFEPRDMPSQDFKIATDESITDRMVELSEERQLNEEQGTIMRKAHEAQDIIAPAVGQRGADAQRIVAVVVEVAKALIAVKSVDEIIAKVMNLIFEHLPADRGCLLLRDQTGELRPKVVHRRSERSSQEAIRISRTIVNKALDDGMAILTQDAQLDPSFSASESIRFLGIKSAMCAPLFHQGKSIGIIYLDSPTSAAMFGQPDLDLLTAMANFAAVGIEQAQLSEKVQQEKTRRERLARYHSPSVVTRILDDVDRGEKEDLLLEPEEREVTILFADIVGFTPMSARMEPRRVADLLNGYFSEMTEIIFKYEGTLDKYIGDAIMAVFGAPNVMPDHPYRAVCAALDMLERLEALNQKRSQDPRFSIRIGINTGRAVAGDIGSSQRMEYTVLGNTVNLASRIESMASKPNQVVVGEDTYRCISDGFVCDDMGPIQLKGIEDKANVYRIIRRL